MAKRPRYTDDFRASVVLMLQAAGYAGTNSPDSKKGSLEKVSKRVNVPARTISRWFDAEQNPPPVEMVNEKRPELISLFEDEMRAIFEEMKVARGDATYRELSTALGIVTDKHILLTGGATERTENKTVQINVSYDNV